MEGSLPLQILSTTNVAKSKLAEINEGADLNISMKFFSIPLQLWMKTLIEGIRTEEMGLVSLAKPSLAQPSLAKPYIQNACGSRNR
jgi:hypothetical protein